MCECLSSNSEGIWYTFKRDRDCRIIAQRRKFLRSNSPHWPVLPPPPSVGSLLAVSTVEAVRRPQEGTPWHVTGEGGGSNTIWVYETLSSIPLGPLFGA